MPSTRHSISLFRAAQAGYLSGTGLVQPEEMDLLRLRQATAAEHAATEESLPLMSPSLNRDVYCGVLRRFHRVVDAWDRWADAHAPADLRDLLKGRRRATLLLQDLLALGEPPALPDDDVFIQRMNKSPAGNPRAVFLGRMYVMEGSTLGGQYIARHVEERLGLTHGHGNAFFTGYGPQTAARWREFKAVLAALPDSETETVIAGARNMFALFAEAMRDEIGTEIARSLSREETQLETSGIARGITR